MSISGKEIQLLLPQLRQTQFPDRMCLVHLQTIGQLPLGKHCVR